MLKHVSEDLGKGMIPEGHPLGWHAFDLAEMLVLTAIGLPWQNNQIPLLPIHWLTIHHGASLPFQNKQLNSTLMPMFT